MEPPHPRAVKLFDARTIAVVTFLLSPLAGGAVWAFNEVRVGRATRGLVACVLGAFITSVLVAAAVAGLPQLLALPIQIGLSIGARHAATAWHDRVIADGLVTSPRFYSGGAVVVAILLAAGIIGGGWFYYASRPREGASCHGFDTVVCDGGYAAFWCDDDTQTMQRVPCHGGCTMEGNFGTCIQGAGNRCVAHAASCFGAQGLVCHEGHQVVSVSCSRCEAGPTMGLECDEPTATVGQPCDTDIMESGEHGVCASDGSAMLMCSSDGVWVVSATCASDDRCDPTRGQCNHPRAVLGAPCTGANGCTAEDTARGNAWVRCTDGTWQLYRHCRNFPCVIDMEGELHCELSVAWAGDPCDEGAACSGDGASRLHCVDGRMTVDATCPGPLHCHGIEEIMCDGMQPVSGGGT